MTLLDIANRIDRNGSARADYVVVDVLRHELLPRFFGDIDSAVGDVFWRRMSNDTVTTVPGLHRYPLPKFFKLMASIGVRAVNGGSNVYPLQYIGNDSHLIRRYAASQASDFRNVPTVYWIDMPTPLGDPEQPLLYQYELVLGPKPDGVYQLDYVYYLSPDMRDKPDEIEMDQFVPFEYQHALIALGRADLIGDRNGGNDPSAAAQVAIYQNWLAGLKSKKNAGRIQIPKFAW